MMKTYSSITALILNCITLGISLLSILSVNAAEDNSIRLADIELEVQTLLQLSEDQAQHNEYDLALISLDRANDLSKSLTDTGFHQQILNNFANIYYQTGQLEQAGRYYRELIEFDEKKGDIASLAVSLFNLAHVDASRNDYYQAELRLNRSLQMSEQLLDDSGAAFTLKALGVNSQAQGDIPLARNYLQRSFERFQSVFDEAQMASVLRHLGDVEQSEGYYEKAIALYQQALPKLLDDEFIDALINGYRGLSSAHEALGDYQQAFVSYRAYSQLLMQEQESKSTLTTQLLQVKFETQHFADENIRLEFDNKNQEQELVHLDEIMQMQFMVLVLSGVVIALVAILLWRSRSHGNKMKALATTDELTKLSNRRAIMQYGEQELQRSRRFNRPFCCFIFDIDHFKKVNDTFGHGAGDDVLRSVSSSVQESLRQTDLVGRIGGEEFLVFSTETSADQAIALAERVRALVESLRHQSLSGRNVTISIGVAHLTNEKSLQEFVKNADDALYQAKESGRNKAVFHVGTGTIAVDQ